MLASWRTLDGRWLVDQLYSEPVDFRVWREVDGHVLDAELRGPMEVLRAYLAGQGVNPDDMRPVGAEEDEDFECE